MTKSVFAIIISFVFIQCTTKSSEENFELLSEQLEPLSQSLEIDSKKDTLITCNSGTLLFFEANSFTLENGSDPSGSIILNIQEFYSTKDFISRDLQTVSDSSLLVSGGMLNISAESNGKPCFLKQNKSYTIFFPKDKNENEDMKIFYGNRENSSDLNWELLPQTNPNQNNLADNYNDSLENLLECKVGLSDFIGVSWSGHDETNTDDRNSKPVNEIYKYASENFIPSPEMTKELCENPNLYVNVSISFTEEGRIEEVKSYGDTTRFDDYVVSFFDTITKKFGDRNDYNSLSGLFHLSAQTSSKTDDYTYSFNSKYSESRSKALNKVDNAELNYYVQSSISFGLINCDYFLKYDSPNLDYFVKSERNGKVYLVFEEFKSLMVSTSKTNEGYLFKNVPKGMAVKTIFISYQNEKPELSIEHSIVSEKGITINNFKEFTLTELDAELAKI